MVYKGGGHDLLILPGESLVAGLLGGAFVTGKVATSAPRVSKLVPVVHIILVTAYEQYSIQPLIIETAVIVNDVDFV